MHMLLLSKLFCLNLLTFQSIRLYCLFDLWFLLYMAELSMCAFVCVCVCVCVWLLCWSPYFSISSSRYCFTEFPWLWNGLFAKAKFLLVSKKYDLHHRLTQSQHTQQCVLSWLWTVSTNTERKKLPILRPALPGSNIDTRCPRTLLRVSFRFASQVTCPASWSFAWGLRTFRGCWINFYRAFCYSNNCCSHFIFSRLPLTENVIFVLCFCFPRFTHVYCIMLLSVLAHFGPNWLH